MKLSYQIAPAFERLGIRNIVVAEIYSVQVTPTPSALQELKEAASREIAALGEEHIEKNQALEGYRELVRSVGRSLKKFPPAAEKLLRQVLRTGRFPTINSAVDAYNLVVAAHGLALGVHDLDLLGTRIDFRLSDGGEPFTPVGGDQVKATQQGDYVYADEGRVLAWLDSSDSNDVKVSERTRNILLVIQGTHRTTKEGNLAAANEACQQIVKFCGGEYLVSTVSPAT
jgi:DNA/RNA-binding domain of Phe-tRNA-synthetase-like protein